MRIKRRTWISIERSSVITIRSDGPPAKRRICPVCGLATAEVTQARASAILAIDPAELAAALAGGEVHSAGPGGALCAASVVDRFPPNTDIAAR